MSKPKPMSELTRIREERGLSQQGLADTSGVNKATINQLERGRRSPNLETLDKLAAGLGVEVADLLPKAQAPLPLDLGWRRGGADDLDELQGERRIAEALWDPTSSDEAFRQAVEMAPPDALYARLDELVRDYHISPKREGLRNQPRAEVISRVKAFARATIINEELKSQGEQSRERHNLVLKAFEKAISDAAPAGYEEQEGQEAG
jgi:transcriptional regulator with XRE-family HTH domain